MRFENNNFDPILNVLFTKSKFQFLKIVYFKGHVII